MRSHFRERVVEITINFQVRVVENIDGPLVCHLDSQLYTSFYACVRLSFSATRRRSRTDMEQAMYYYILKNMG